MKKLMISLLIVLLVVALVAGCSKQAPVEPNVSAEEPTTEMPEGEQETSGSISLTIIPKDQPEE